jgi:hypothetical protein
LADRRLYLGVAARLRGCSPQRGGALHSPHAYKLQLEVLETELLLLPRLAAALAQAMQIGYPKFDMDALPTVVQQAYDNVLHGLPYVAGPDGEKSVVQRERQALIKRARERRDRLLKGRENQPPEEPKLKPVAVGKRKYVR